MTRIQWPLLFALVTIGCHRGDPPPKSDNGAIAALEGSKTSVHREEQEPLVPVFTNVAAEMGIVFEYERGEAGHFWPVEPTGGGAGWLDFDLDGLIDLVLVQGAQLPVDPQQRFLASRIYQNQWPDRFVDVTEATGLMCHDYGQGVGAADFDNDGDSDLVITNYGRSAFYRNNNDGTFTEITDVTGTVGGEWNTGATFADLDRDGVLDLYLANYFHFETEGYKPCALPDSTPQYCGPMGSEYLADFLYRGTGTGTFDNASRALGDPVPKAPGFGAVAADFDQNGWPDLYVANDAAPNILWHNQTAERGQLAFEDIAYDAGVAVNADGVHQASMGIACGDIDGNGTLDLGLSHFIFEYCTLYANHGDMDFSDVTGRWGLIADTYPTMGWGMGFFDYDHDGWLDLFVANGHINRTGRDSEPYEMRHHLFRNLAGQRYVEVLTPESGDLVRPVVARGSAMGDFDNDGRTDLAIVHHHSNAALMHNRTLATGGFIMLELVGRRSNRDAIHAKIKLRIGDGATSRVLFHEIVSGDNYLSNNDRRVCLGLGGEPVRGCEINWPGGWTTELGELPANSRWLVIEPLSQEQAHLVPAP